MSEEIYQEKKTPKNSKSQSRKYQNNTSHEKTYFSPLNTFDKMRWGGTFGVGNRFLESKEGNNDLYYDIPSDFDVIVHKGKQSINKPFGGTLERFSVFRNDAPPPGSYFKTEIFSPQKSLGKNNKSKKSLKESNKFNKSKYNDKNINSSKNISEDRSENNNEDSKISISKLNLKSDSNPTSPINRRKSIDSLELSQEFPKKSKSDRESFVSVTSIPRSSSLSFSQSDLIRETFRPAFGSSSPRFMLTEKSDTIAPILKEDSWQSSHIFKEHKKASKKKFRNVSYPFSTTLERFPSFKSDSPPPTKYNIEGIDIMLSSRKSTNKIDESN